MTLKEYLALPGAPSQVEFAARLGKQRAYINNLVNAGRCPSLVMAVRIRDLTLGMVTVDDLIPDRLRGDHDNDLS